MALVVCRSQGWVVALYGASFVVTSREAASLEGTSRSRVGLTPTYHDWEYDSSHCRLQDPKESQTHNLEESEEVDPAKGDMS